jgi:hypothetical protein
MVNVLEYAGATDISRDTARMKLPSSKAEKNRQVVSLVFPADTHGRTRLFIRLQIALGFRMLLEVSQDVCSSR